MNLAPHDGKTNALRFLSHLKAELDVQEFERKRDHLCNLHTSGERGRRAAKAQRDLMNGVIPVEAEVKPL